MAAKEHALCVHINQGHPDLLAIATVHFPPRMHPETKAKHGEAVANFLTNAHATVSFIQGDLNDDVKRSYKGWLKGTLTKSWKEFHCPYTTGQPTNHVITRKRVSMTEIDWLFLHSSTPCVACTREQLAGLSTRNAQQYTLAIDLIQMKPTDPSNRRYDFRHVNQEDFQEVANACSILFAWAHISEWHPTAVMHMYLTAMDDIIPRCRSKMSLTSTYARVLATSLQSHSGKRSAEIAPWWENRNNKAMAAKLHFPLEKLKGVSITSTTTHATKLKKNNFPVVDKISADGKYFPTEKAEFQEEMLKQAQELYSGRPDIAVDIEHMKKGMEFSPDAPEDKPHFLTHMLKLQRERKGLPLEDPAGKAPDFHKFTDLVRRPSSEATCLEQLPHAIVSRLDGFSRYLFTSLLQAFTQGAHDQLLRAVLHLCLIKKQPEWLITNSRPILLEPYLP